MGRFSRSASHTVSFDGFPLNSTRGVPTLSNLSSRQRTLAVSSMSGVASLAVGEADGDGEAEGRPDGRADGNGEGEGEEAGEGGTGWGGRWVAAAVDAAAARTATMRPLVIRVLSGRRPHGGGGGPSTIIEGRRAQQGDAIDVLARMVSPPRAH